MSASRRTMLLVYGIPDRENRGLTSGGSIGPRSLIGPIGPIERRPRSATSLSWEYAESGVDTNSRNGYLPPTLLMEGLPDGPGGAIERNQDSTAFPDPPLT